MIQTFETLHGLFDSVAVSSAFLNLQGHILSTKTKYASTMLSPVQAARFAVAYIPLQDGDWMAVNDPHIGGVTPHGINFLGRIDQLIWSIRIEKSKPWNELEKWEQVGHKIPPLPIKLAGRLNDQIPKNFLDLVSSSLDQLDPIVSKLYRFCKFRKNIFTYDSLDSYFKKSQNSFKNILKDTPWTEFVHKAHTQSGETLNAKVSFHEKCCSIDLTGSSLSNDIQLSEKIVDSILIFALNKSLNTLEFYNHGTENFFQVLKPRQSWLSHSEPKYPARSHLIGAPFLESHIKQMLLKMKKPVENWSSSRNGWFQARSLTSGNFITSDQLKQCWGASCKFLKVQTSLSNGLSILVAEDCELLSLNGGKFFVQTLKPGQAFEFIIS